jgi:hypothetical protein
MKFNALAAFVPASTSFSSSSYSCYPNMLSASSRDSLSMISTMPLCMATNHEEEVDIMDQTHFSRRSFLRQKATTIATSAAFYGFFVNFDDHASNCQCSTCQGLKENDGHDESCQCNVCSNANNMVGHHGKTCQCHHCMRLGPLAANAYERDVGDENRSPETYAMNLQVSISLHNGRF